MVSFQWSVFSGQWAVVSGQWAVVSGQWSVVGGRWSVVGGRWSVVSGQLSVVSCQLSVVSGQWAVLGVGGVADVGGAGKSTDYAIEGISGNGGGAVFRRGVFRGDAGRGCLRFRCFSEFAHALLTP